MFLSVTFTSEIFYLSLSNFSIILYNLLIITDYYLHVMMVKIIMSPGNISLLSYLKGHLYLIILIYFSIFLPLGATFSVSP